VPQDIGLAVHIPPSSWRDRALASLARQPLLPTWRLRFGLEPRDVAQVVTIVADSGDSAGTALLPHTESMRGLVLVTSNARCETVAQALLHRDHPWAVVLAGEPPTELAQAVAAVAHGGGWLSNGVLSRLRGRGDGGSLPRAEESSSPRGPSAWLSSLTNREHETVQLLCDGRSHREIAEELHVARSTLKSHVRSILRKAGCANSRELIARLYRDRPAGVGPRD
jgi:DNA-binding NarL/FixJ family response regulator